MVNLHCCRRSPAPFGFIVFLILFSLSHWAAAQLPLTVEDLLVKQNRYQFSLGANYHNSARQSLALAYQENTDRLGLDASLRYGLNLSTEISARIHGRHYQSRYSQGQQRDSEAATAWGGLGIGLNHSLLPEGKHPALLAFANLSLTETVDIEGRHSEHFNRLSLGLTSYRNIDPLLLSLVASLTGNRGYHLDRAKIKPGASLLLRPQVAFAVNPVVTLTGGVQWLWRQSSQVDGDTLGINTTDTELIFGLGYNFSEQLSLSFDSNFSISGDNGAGLSLVMIYRMDG